MMIIYHDLLPWVTMIYQLNKCDFPVGWLLWFGTSWYRWWRFGLPNLFCPAWFFSCYLAIFPKCLDYTRIILYLSKSHGSYESYPIETWYIFTFFFKLPYTTIFSSYPMFQGGHPKMPGFFCWSFPWLALSWCMPSTGAMRLGSGWEFMGKQEQRPMRSYGPARKLLFGHDMEIWFLGRRDILCSVKLIWLWKALRPGGWNFTKYPEAIDSEDIRYP